MKIVLNKAVGTCFGLSEIAVNRLCKRKGWNRGPVLGKEEISTRIRGLQRSDQDLVDIVGSLGTLAAGASAELEIVDIPDGFNWTISEVVGFEFIELNGKIF
jgi:hypothetical protein